MTALLMCPFCKGKKPRLRSEYEDPSASGGYARLHFVECTKIKCGARGPVFKQTAESHNHFGQLAKDAWNNRGTQP